ncbi:hypothetical protein [Streptomyces atratus]|uniref:hypothetical protein n=1 Tax=Streptomyces atratus TaxID=1893 RepID=UPI003409CAD2
MGSEFGSVGETVLRLEELLFPSIADIAVLSVDVNDEAVGIEARCTIAGSNCAGCRGWSERVHSSYEVPLVARSP